MKHPHRFWLVALAAVPVLAQAHTHLQGAIPANGSTLASSPASITLKFSEATRITAITLQQADGAAEQALGPLPDAAAKDVTVAAPQLSPGSYVVKWRALGVDNHVTSGVLKFTVSAKPVSGES